MSIREALQQIGYKIELETSDFYRMRPLYRDSSTNTCLAVNKKTGWFTDWVTSQSGSFKDLVAITTGQKNYEVTFDTNHTDELKEEIMETFQLDHLLPSYSFYNKRGISDETLKIFKGGFCNGGKMYNRFVFPIINPDGQIVGQSGRTIMPEPKDEFSKKSWIKWKHLGKKNKWVYPYYFNKDELIKSKQVILTESHGNMLALWEAGIKNSLIVFGTSLSKDLLASILEINPRKIIIAMDNDSKKDGSNPGLSGAQKIYQKLELWFDKSTIELRLPPLGKDIGDMLMGSKESVQKLYGI